MPAWRVRAVDLAVIDFLYCGSGLFWLYNVGGMCMSFVFSFMLVRGVFLGQGPIEKLG